ncbi:MAG: RAD55 family ATPase [Halobacteriota archaeon]
MTTLATGIDILDRQLEGGIPSGSVVALKAPASSNAELLLYQLTAARRSLYLTTVRSSAAVRDGIRMTKAPTGEPTIRELTGAEVLDQANRAIGRLSEDTTLIIDPLDPIEERELSRFVTFINDLQTHLQNTGAFAVLHCLDDGVPPDNRKYTLNAADVVFDLNVEVRGSTLVNRLTVPKNRGGVPITEEIKLELVDEVAVDVSRDIA